jgi:hypothetical protein
VDVPHRRAILQLINWRFPFHSNKS